MTLAAISEQLAERVGRQFDVPFKKQLEDLAIVWRARMLTNSLAKNPSLKNYYKQSFIIDLEEVNKDECDELADCNCENVLRGNKDLPQSLRIGPNPFDYLGSPGGSQPFSWTTFAAERYFNSNKYTAKLPRYTLLNRRPYIFNEHNQEKLRVEDVFDDPRELAKFSCSQTEFVPCYTAATEFVMDNAVTQIVMDDILNKALRFQPTGEEIEIKTDKNV